jgi:hypothetical protein
MQEGGNSVMKRHFGPPLTERRKEEEFKKLEKNKNSFCTHTAQWPNLEAEVKK